MTHYKNPYIANVILRLDFVSKEESLNKSLPPNLRQRCIEHFNVPEERKKIAVRPGNEKIEIVDADEIEWHFFDKNHENEVCICSSAIYISFTRYDNFSDFKKAFFDIADVLFDELPSIRINRIGLRYIDKIDMTDNKAGRKSWSGFWSRYITKSLTHFLEFPDEDNSISRCFGSIDMNYDDCMLRFQYGISNPDYPAPNRKKLFVFDTDVFVHAAGDLDLPSAKNRIDKFHEKAKEWFEKAIKDDLRKKMGE